MKIKKIQTNFRKKWFTWRRSYQKKIKDYLDADQFDKAYEVFSDYTDGRYEKLCSKTGTKLYNEALKNKKYSQAITYGKYLDDNKKIYDNETKKILGEKTFYLH